MKPRRLLVVEDDPHLREMYAETLMMNGFEVVTAQDGIEALELFLEQGPFDAVIVDHDMPRLTGRQLLKRLRGLGEGTPALLISGRLELDQAEQKTLGLGPVLAKPFALETLLLAVKRLLSA